MTDPDPELVEQAAKALWKASPHAQSRWGFVNNKDRGEYRHQARAALAALGEISLEKADVPEWYETGEMVPNQMILGPDMVPERKLRFIPSRRWVSSWMPAAPVGGSGHNNGDQP